MDINSFCDNSDGGFKYLTGYPDTSGFLARCFHVVTLAQRHLFGQ